MLEADEVDIDYFTPAASTSLAKLFNNDTKLDNEDNPSLKYVSKTTQSQKYEDSKGTKIIHACGFYGYEWLNNAYVSRGKLGAAILKTLKTEQYSILLYESNKATLSSTNITANFEVVIKEKTSISFYDNHQKYWSIHGTETDTTAFVNKLMSINVSIKKLTNTDTNPDPNTVEAQDISNQIDNDIDKESDTDSSMRKKTKDSILKRMATMGHSVLPKQMIKAKNVEDSTDSDENAQKIVKHKTQKNYQKKMSTETIDFVDSSYEDINLKKMTPQFSDNISRSSYDHQLVPIKSTNIINNPVINNSSELSLFMSEQRINNSELRINVNRVSDKIDKIMDSVQKIGDQLSIDVTKGFQNDIVQKLLNEYENKIKSYENFFNFKGIDCNSILKSSQETKSLKDCEFYKIKMQELQNIIENQKLDNTKTLNELKTLEEKYDILLKKKEDCDDHIKEICALKKELEFKSEQIKKLSNVEENNPSLNINKLETKLKAIMNKTFHSLSTNFENDESYTGSAVKTLIANIIKKETMEALKEV